MNPLDELNELNYVSSAADLDLTPKPDVKPQDQDDFSTLEAVMQLLANRKAYYMTVDAVDLSSSEEKVRAQIKDNKRMVFHISELEQMITTTVRKVKETFNGR